MRPASRRTIDVDNLVKATKLLVSPRLDHSSRPSPFYPFRPSPLSSVST